MRTCLLLLLLPLCSAATLRADPPSGPLLRPPGDFSHWQVVSVYSGKALKKDRAGRRAKTAPAAVSEERLQKLVTTRTGRLVHEERTDFAQRTTDVWYDGGTQYTRPAGGSGWLRTESTSGDSSYRPLPDIGYRDVGLIRTDRYVATLPYDNRPCLVFVPDPAPKIDWAKPAAQKQLKSLDTVALVDAETRLPVEIRAGGETRTFQFDPPPTRMQTLPADLLSQAKRGDDARARLNQPAPRPY